MIEDIRMETDDKRYSTVLYDFCMCCKKFLGTKDGHGITGMSHGLCDKCYNSYMEEPNKKPEKNQDEPCMYLNREAGEVLLKLISESD